MHFDGNGNAIRDTNWTSDATNGVPISSSEMDTEFNGVAACLTDCMTRDGQGAATAPLNMGNFRLTNLGAGTQSTDAAQVGQIVSVQSAAIKNIVRNGGMMIAQRGTSFSSPASGTVTLDGWRVNFSGGTGGTFTISQNTNWTGNPFDNFAQPVNSALTTSRTIQSGGLRWQQTVAGTATAAWIEQRIPDARRFSNVYLMMIYCWMNASGTTTGDKVEIGINFGTGGSPSATTVLLTSTFGAPYTSRSWRDIRGQIPELSDNGIYTWGSNLDDYLFVRIYRPSGTTTTFDDTVGAVALVQNVNGNTSNYAFYPYASFEEELFRCQRYYYKTFPYATAPAQNAGTAGAFAYNAFVNGATASRWTIPLPIPVWNKVTPTVTTYNPSAANTNWRNVNDAGDSGASTIAMVGDRAVVITNAQVATDGPGEQLIIHFTVDAEP